MRCSGISTAIDRATRDVPADFLDAPGATLCDSYLIVNAVEGLAPGTYHYRRREASLELLREGSFRAPAGHRAAGLELALSAASFSRPWSKYRVIG